MANTGLGLFYTTVELSVHPIFFINIVILYLLLYIYCSIYIYHFCILLEDYFLILY